jgi:hypothetical protein
MNGRRRFRFEIVPWTGDDAATGGSRSHDPSHKGRSPVLAEAFARLEIAWRLDDPDAAFRVLRELQGTPEGEWLGQVMAAVTVRQFSDHLRGIPRQLDNETHER